MRSTGGSTSVREPAAEREEVTFAIFLTVERMGSKRLCRSDIGGRSGGLGPESRRSSRSSVPDPADRIYLRPAMQTAQRTRDSELVDESRQQRPSFSIVCLSSQRWDVQLPTNRQQIMCQAGARGHPVLFVSTSGFAGRAPEAALRRRVAKAPRAPLEPPPTLKMARAANMLPWGHKYALAARTNARLTGHSLRTAIRQLEPPVVLWIYDPCMVGVADVIRPDLTVYDCVDDYAEQTGSDRRRRALVQAADVRAAERADLVFTTTTSLLRRHAARNPKTFLVHNVGDFDHFSRAGSGADLPDELKSLARPIIGFAGNLLPLKVDYDLLAFTADQRPDWTVLLVGPLHGPSDEIERLTARPNVVWIGPRAYTDLPLYVAAFDVALIPYRSNTYTESCFPLKLYEYLAAGKPVVATGVPDLAGMEPDVVLASDRTQFVSGIQHALTERNEPARTRRIALAAGNTWETRASRLLELISHELTVV